MHKVCSRLNWQDNIELTDLIIEEFNNEMELEEVSEVADIIGLSGEEYIVVQNAIVRYMAKVEEFFMIKIKELARKNNFIDSIMIDTNFNVHIYKNITFDTKRICNRIKKLGVESYWTEYGTVHCQGLLTSANVKDLNEFVSFYDMKNEKISILQEIEKSRLSKGEKQVFIFSTNEEIVGENYEKMKNRIQAEFLLENSDNLQTIVYANESGLGNTIADEQERVGFQK